MRIEHDFLGELEVPDNAYYGVQSLRGSHNFNITGQKLDSDFIIALAMVKKAAAMANLKTARLDSKIAKALIAAADEIIAGKLHDNFIVDPVQGGAGTSINMNMNEVLCNRALEIIGKKKGRYDIISPNNHANMAQSTNDTFPTAIKLCIILKSRKLKIALKRLSWELERKAQEFKDVLKMGRTHLQDAVPITLGQEMSAYASGVNRGLRRIEHALINLHYINMGGTAIGTGLNAEPNYIPEVAKILSVLAEEDFHVAENLIDATNNTDGFADMSSALKNTALMLIKMANDFRLMASGPRCGLNELKLPARQPGSSIMPGKVNPVIAEVLNQTCYQIIGNDTAICLAVENGQFELNVMEPVIAFNLFNSLKYMTNAVNTFVDNLLIDLEANKEQCYTWLNHSVGTITALLPHIGYENASMIAKEAYQTNKPVREIILSKNLLTEEELDIILSPSEMTRPGIAGDKLLKENLRKRA
ncbi:aspartate ammonia-lyase [Megamonas funiformis]|uniref:aspartate ammonia-lyase n=1 Tax=Megamonas funiformis TaxID=437897 RepID=UPI00195ED87C|nr:aspartate ammonia-lyase [Megamonas funiformis]MBM6726613.1 aspartate ammonia-lyase [Megamonas funiformis]